MSIQATRRQPFSIKILPANPIEYIIQNLNGLYIIRISTDCSTFVKSKWNKSN